ncbi:MAG: sulfatase-like hydrolase/transferase [Verrucomicrobiales bacterium]|nr:sulfatase-like hydrolase/transferase [Verrucomicrobiales bacterium]
MNRQFFLILAILCSTVFAQATDRPNILFIFTDDQTHRSVSCYPEAHPWVNTPNIDALAEKGVRFANAYIGSWCMAARATLLTGHLSYGVNSMKMSEEKDYPASEYDPEQCPFWPSVFRKNGYQTAQIGKWHTGTDNGFGRDWDYQIVWNRPQFPENAGNYFYDQLIQKNGSKAEMVKGYSTDNYTNWALDYINGKEGRDPDKPWYLWLCYGAVHGPFTPAERHLETYPDAKIKIPEDIYPPREGKPKYSREKEQWIPGPDGLPVLKSGKFSGKTVDGAAIHGTDIHSIARQYHQGVLAIDEGVGQLVEALKKTGQYENTLVIFASDQGIAWGQKGFQIKLAPYDGTIRGPLIVSMPSRFESGKTCEKPVGGADLVPTIFTAAGLELPWEMHGRDLTPLLKDPSGGGWDTNLLSAHTGVFYGSDEVPDMKVDMIFRNQSVPWWISLRTDRYKYIRNLLPGEVEELYDMENDPEEIVNLAMQDEHLELVRKLRAEAIAELRRTDCRFVDNLPPVAKE